MMIGEPFRLFLPFLRGVRLLHYIVRVGYVFFHVVTDHFSLISRREDFFLHHTFANGCHLRAVFRVHNRSNDVTTESRTDLIQQVLVSLTFFLVFVVTDFSEVQSAVNPLVKAEETRGPRSRPITVAPMRQICGCSSLKRFTRIAV